MHSDTRIGAVSIKTADLLTMKVFYRDVIGLEVLEDSGQEVQLGVGKHVLVHLISLPGGEKLLRSTGLYHMAIRVPTRADLANWLRHYISVGNPFWQGASDHVFSEALYLSDPEGNGIEVYADTPKSSWPREKDGSLAAFTNPLDLQSLIDENEDSPWDGLPEGTDMGHVHLKVNDLAKARHFYTDVLGFDIKTEYQGSALFVAAGDYHHHIGMNTWQSAGTPALPDGALGLAGYSILSANGEEYTRMRNALTANGYTVTDGEDHFSVEDPSGNRIRVY